MPAPAQYPSGATVQPLPRGDDPAELLAQALRTLATEPNNIQALTTAGHNALVLGDPNAAVGFFGRASELAPRDGRVKAGLGSALVQLEKPADALRLFGEASALGVPDADLAEDRGLAYDLTGDFRRAQRDYAGVLAVHPDDDTVRRRLALSQGIAGDKNGAIATLDPLIRRRDIAGWRAQTFVLAMNGDASGAGYITHIMMPQQADRMQPFLVRLATLSPADKARAVHFGEMPQGGSSYTPTQLAAANAPATYAPAPSPVAAPVSRPARPVTQVAVAAPDDLAPAPAPKSETAAPPIHPKPAPVPAPSAARAEPVPERDAVTTGASNPARFIGPPAETAARLQTAAVADTALAPAPARTQVAVASTPAPLAAMAFGSADAAPTPAASTASSVPPVPVPVPSLPVPVAASPPVVADTAPSSDAGAPRMVAVAPSLPSAAATGHYDLPHDPSPATASRAMPVATPAPREPSAATRPRVVRDKVAAVGSAPPVDADEPAMPRSSRRSRRADDRASAASKAADAADRKSKEQADDEPAPTAKGKRLSARKGKADAAADDGKGSDTASDRGRGKKDGESTARADIDSKARKGSKSDYGDTAASTKTKHGKSGGKGAGSDDGEGKTAKVYVQVAGGANKDDMDKAWAGVKARAPDLMKGRAPSTTPLKATNRLLVGPFKSDEEAQAFVNKMAGKGLSGFTFKSAKGQRVEKVDSAK